MKILARLALAGAVAAAFCAPPDLLAAPLGPLEITVGPDLVALRDPVSCDRYADVARWAAQHMFRFTPGEGVCRNGRGSPAVALGWNTAAVWANALSEMSGFQPAYRDAGGAIVRDGTSLGIVPAASADTDGYRLPTLREMGLPRLRARMSRDIQEWTTSRIDLGDGRPYYYMCKPGACDFHSSGMSGRGVGFRLVRRGAPRG